MILIVDGDNIAYKITREKWDNKNEREIRNRSHERTVRTYRTQKKKEVNGIKLRNVQCLRTVLRKNRCQEKYLLLK